MNTSHLLHVRGQQSQNKTPTFRPCGHWRRFLSDGGLRPYPCGHWRRSSRMEAYAPIRVVTERCSLHFDHCVFNGVDQLLTFEARPIPPRVEDLLESHAKVHV